MRRFCVWVMTALLAVACLPVQADQRPSYEELERRVAEAEAGKSRASEIANTALTALQKEIAAKEAARQDKETALRDLELSTRLVGKLNELVDKQEKVIASSGDLIKFLEARVTNLLDIATTFEKELLVLKGENQAFRTFAEELRQNAEHNKKVLDRWGGITTRKQLPAGDVLRNNFLSIRWRFRTFNEELFKALDMLDISIEPETTPQEEPERPKAEPGKITS